MSFLTDVTPDGPCPGNPKPQRPEGATLARRKRDLETQMIRPWRISLLMFALYGGLAAAQSGRGELLYSTYCDGCHTEQVHWREKKLATNWTILVAEVRRWQAIAKLEWSRDDVEAVARYLNALHYHYPLPER